MTINNPLSYFTVLLSKDPFRGYRHNHFLLKFQYALKVNDPIKCQDILKMDGILEFKYVLFLNYSDSYKAGEWIS